MTAYPLEVWSASTLNPNLISKFVEKQLMVGKGSKRSRVKARLDCS